MSDETPTITVTRGSSRGGDRQSSSEQHRRAGSESAWPSPIGVVSGVIRGVRNAWWAGLGLLSVAEETGTKVFDALVERGQSWEQVRRDRSEATARRVRRLVERVPGTEAVEARVRDELHTLLHRLGVPRRDDFEELRQEVEVLDNKVERLVHSIDPAEDELD